METPVANTRVGNARAIRQSKAGKKQKNLYLSHQARRLLAALSFRMGISETAVVELMIREKAARENIVLHGQEAGHLDGYQQGEHKFSSPEELSGTKQGME